MRGLGRLVADTCKACEFHFGAVGTEMTMALVPEAASGGDKSERNLLQAVCSFSIWSIDHVIAFLKRCLTDEAFAVWAPYASLLRGPARNAFQSIRHVPPTADCAQNALVSRVNGKTKDFTRFMSRNTPEDRAAAAAHALSGPALLSSCLFAIRYPTSSKLQFETLGQYADVLSTGLLQPIFINSFDSLKGTFFFADDPSLMAALTQFLRGEHKMTSLSMLTGQLDDIEKHPSGEQTAGFLLEVAVGLALTEASNFTERGAFLQYMRRYEYHNKYVPDHWKSLFQRVHVAPQRVSSFQSQDKAFKTLADFLKAVEALEPTTYFAFCLEIYLTDTNAGPDLVWFVGLSPAAPAAAHAPAAGFLIMFLVGLKWYGGSIPAAEKDKNKRSVNPSRFYTDLKKGLPEDKARCEELSDLCQESMKALMPKLAGIVSMEFLLEHNKQSVPSQHNPFVDTSFNRDGYTVPWLQITVTKEMISGYKREDGAECIFTPEEAVANSPLNEFGAHPAFRKDPVNINAADTGAIVKGVVGVGKKLAVAIVVERTTNGHFQNIDEAVRRLPLSAKILSQFSYP